MVSSVEPISSNEIDQHLEVGADIDDGGKTAIDGQDGFLTTKSPRMCSC